MPVSKKRLEGRIKREELSKEEKKKAVEDLASLKIKLPSWEKLEKEIEKMYEERLK